MVKEISDEFFNKAVLGNKGAVLLLIYAPWCGDCRRILPVFKEISGLPGHKDLCFLTMDVDKNPYTKKRLKVERYPTLYLFQDGRKVAEQGAEVSAEEQKRIIQSLLSHPVLQCQ